MKTKNTRTTAARTEIEQLFHESDAALSHADLKERMTESCDRVTIYRILDRLTEEGRIHKIITAEGAVKYAACHSCSGAHRHDHIHFSCQRCQSVTCLEHITPTFKLPEGYTVMDMQFTVSGVCGKCAEDWEG